MDNILLDQYTCISSLRKQPTFDYATTGFQACQNDFELGRRIKVSRRHWRLQAPQAGGEGFWGSGSQTPSGLQGQHPVGVPRGEGPRSKTDLRFLRELKLVLLGAMLTTLSICFQMKIINQFFFNFLFHYSLRCHILVHVTSIFFLSTVSVLTRTAS